MLMLQGSQITKTEVFSKSGDRVKRLPGVRYDERLFTLEVTYDSQQKQEALEHCRKVFSENGEKKMVLFVENEDEYVIWIENPSVKPAGPRPDRVKKFSLEAVAAKMRNVNGVKIKDRTYRLKVYPKCFLGTEAVRWFMHQLNLSHEDAIRLGQRLIDEKWVHHVLDAHNFKDEELFYRFYWDEE